MPPKTDETETGTRTAEEITADLIAVRAELEACDKAALHARQKALWSEGRVAGMDSRALAEPSGVESVTVRLYWHPQRAAERAEARKGTPRKKAGK